MHDSNRDWRWLTLFCMARAAFSFIFMSYSAALPLLREQWAMSPTRAGMIQSAWHLGYLVSLFVVGLLGDRFGAKRVYLWSSVVAGVSALVFASFASGFVSGLVLYGICGLCSGGSYTPGLTLLAENFPPASRGRAMGFYLASGSLGYALSVIFSGMLFPVGGWRLAFLVTGSMPCFGLLLSLWCLRHTPNRVYAGSAVSNLRYSLTTVVKDKPVLLSMLSYTFHSWELLGLWAWLPAYLAAAAQASGTAGNAAYAVEYAVALSGLTYFTSMLGSFIGGILSDRWGRSASILLFSCVSLTFSFTFGWMFGGPLTILFAAAAIYNLVSIADSSIHSTALTELVKPQNIGAAYAVRSVLGFGAGAISPMFFGLMIDLGRSGTMGSEYLGWGLAWTCLGLGALPGPLMSWRLRRRPEARLMAGGLG